MFRYHVINLVVCCCWYYEVLLHNETSALTLLSLRAKLRNDVIIWWHVVCSRGVIQNLVDVMGWRCCGLARPANVNWQSVYTMEDYADAVTSQTRRRTATKHDLV